MPDAKNEGVGGTVGPEVLAGNGPCACMGPQGADPHCPCEMRRRGLQPTEIWTEANKDKLDVALGRMFGWQTPPPAPDTPRDEQPTAATGAPGPEAHGSDVQAAAGGLTQTPL